VRLVDFEGQFSRGDIGQPRREECKSPLSRRSVTYEMAGVDIDAGNAAVEGIKDFVKATGRPGCDFSSDLACSFGGVCDLAKLNYKDPVLISGTDGVGTKLKIAQTMDAHDTIGQDLVAMCVNDCLVHGAEPLFFLDYFATGKLRVEQMVDVVRGVAEGSSSRTARSSAGRPRRCRACTRTASTISRVSLSAWWSDPRCCPALTRRAPSRAATW
jgi:hypothetical protein